MAFGPRPDVPTQHFWTTSPPVRYISRPCSMIGPFNPSLAGSGQPALSCLTSHFHPSCHRACCARLSYAGCRSLLPVDLSPTLPQQLPELVKGLPRLQLRGPYLLPFSLAALSKRSS